MERTSGQKLTRKTSSKGSSNVEILWTVADEMQHLLTSKKKKKKEVGLGDEVIVTAQLMLSQKKIVALMRHTWTDAEETKLKTLGDINAPAARVMREHEEKNGKQNKNKKSQKAI